MAKSTPAIHEAGRETDPPQLAQLSEEEIASKYGGEQLEERLSASVVFFTPHGWLGKGRKEGKKAHPGGRGRRFPESLINMNSQAIKYIGT